MRRAKIVATFGPAIASYENTVAVLRAGVDVARMNMSHGDHSVHNTTYENVRRASAELGKPVGIFADLQGPKIRLGRFTDGPHFLNRGDVFTITVEDVPGTAELCSTTYKGLPGDVNVGDILLIDDGKVALRATSVDDKQVVTEVTVPGPVSNNKGINLPGVAVNVPAMSEKDEADLRWAIRRGVDMVALSFVRNAADVVRVHEIMDEEGRRVPVIAKIEKPQAVAAIEEIIDAFDAIMVARGDLGVELPLEDVPMVQKNAIELARRWAKPVIVATQVLESMIESPRPTRAEASDCANAVLDGADAVMLSGETSVGKYPIDTVKTMARIIESTEEHGLNRVPPLGSKPRTRGGAITRAAVEIADQLDAACICTFTQSGDSARRLSRLRPKKPVFAFTPVESTLNYMSLFWGIRPLLVEFAEHTDTMTAQVDRKLLENGIVEEDAMVVIAAGSPPGQAGSTNLLKVHRVGDAADAGESRRREKEKVGPWPVKEANKGKAKPI
ncbi:MULTISPECIES: pyruvate kinase [Arthrobacter]|uniref:Pyruvate kinase n=1 Tax=Arthrobacter caoxuetaonis TaxID=2886935 RepID=A0A9X1MF58_9MICC|nr:MULTISPECIES: pyruvate kinase [Arthrobacter]MCC3283570.1 pyruvate kinase [Arthrobacter caoxuetaonis]MCC3298968.1 pyruvate kinase [Arthrobacter caoxuetaonis]MCC9193327.1 pyruvate kinase [Arthrobacter sp. zg-Y916]USQ58691.1 pyruvate kinase [Arthrobacter caoxuetaonis]